MSFTTRLYRPGPLKLFIRRWSVKIPQKVPFFSFEKCDQAVVDEQNFHIQSSRLLPEVNDHNFSYYLQVTSHQTTDLLRHTLPPEESTSEK